MVGAAALGGGGVLLSGSGAAAISSSFDASPVSIPSDTGDINEITLAPESVVEWENFDVPVTKVRQTMFARLVRDGSALTPTPEPNPVSGEDGWWPIYRGTPWLFTTDEVSDPDFEYNGEPAELGHVWPYMNDLTVDDGDNQKGPGTSGMLDYKLNASPEDNWVPRYIYVVTEDEAGPPKYDESMLTGVSIGGSPGYINGSYGTVGDTNEIDNAEDGTTKTTTVELGLLTTLHTDYDFAENVSVPDDPNPDRLSPLAMGNSDDVDHAFGDDTHSIPYADLIDNAASHPAVTFDEAAFDVTATNEPSDQGSDTTADTGGS